ncbi:hypothetical protein [Marinoscillum pacificum]|uniref:hypothetical protein n=1 Tax=Marinoscillum pacificum TaxID=392723 RepID=UPI0021576E3D|nr:hypothetical protein [Marinoscillum pacificum]
MQTLLTYSHATSGGIVLLLGLLNFINRTGNKNHVVTGRIYVGAMWWICLSAFIIIAFYRFSFFLMVIRVLTFYSSFVGVRVLRRRKSNSEKWYDWLVSGLTAVFGLGLIGYAIAIFIQVGSFHWLGALSVLFGYFSMSSGIRDIRFFLSNRKREDLWWLSQHINAIGGSYVAAITAFVVQNSRLFMPDDYNWLAWVLPPALLTPVISGLAKRYKQKRARLAGS